MGERRKRPRQATSALEPGMLHNAVTLACPPYLGSESDPCFDVIFLTPIPSCCHELLEPKPCLEQVARKVHDTDCAPTWQESHEARMPKAKCGSWPWSLLERASLGSRTRRVEMEILPPHAGNTASHHKPCPNTCPGPFAWRGPPKKPSEAPEGPGPCPSLVTKGPKTGAPNPAPKKGGRRNRTPDLRLPSRRLNRRAAEAPGSHFPCFRGSTPQGTPLAQVTRFVLFSL